jgi:hypothetical protein
MGQRIALHYPIWIVVSAEYPPSEARTVYEPADSFFAARELGLPFQIAWNVTLWPGESVRALALIARVVRTVCQTKVEPENTENPSLLLLGGIVMDWLLVFFNVNVMITDWPGPYCGRFVVSVAVTGCGF